MLSLDPDYLRSFLAISETGSYGAAAARVHKTQSTISAQMKRLEDALGVTLFEKCGRRNAITPEGQRLLEYAKSIVRLNAETMNAFKAPKLKGAIKIGMSDDYAQAFLPPVLVKFAQDFPHIEVEIVTDDSTGLKKRSDLDSFDAAVVSCNSGFSDLETIRTDRLHWIGAEAHDVHHQPRLPIALWSDGCAWRAKTLAALAKADRPFRIVHTTSNAPLLRAVVKSGLAVTIGPKWYLAPGLRILGEMDRAYPLGEDALAIKIFNSDAQEPLEKFLDYIRTHFRGEGRFLS